MSDPGKRVDTLLWTTDWKAFRLAARASGLTLRDAAAIAIREWVLRNEDGGSWTCAARKQSLPEPDDCDWPVCGCDPYAMRVIDALQESGLLASCDTHPKGGDGEATAPAPLSGAVGSEADETPTLPSNPREPN